MKRIKRVIKSTLIVVCAFTLCGCDMFKSDVMKDIDIYTTIYPLKYLTETLYKDNAKVHSIYPSGADISEYKLSSKKLNEYSKSDLFIFNSLDKDRDYAVTMINKNSNLKMIDVAMGMNYNYSIEELWLNPYNYLMMGQNVKTGLSEYISDPYLIEEIENNYDELKYNLSSLDAQFKETINYSAYDTIVVDNDVFKFLEKYNLKVISLEENDELTTPIINEAKKLISSGKVKYIYSLDSESNNTVKEILNTYNIELITINGMMSIDGNIESTNEDYLTIMNNNIDLLKKELYK